MAQPLVDTTTARPTQKPRKAKARGERGLSVVFLSKTPWTSMKTWGRKVSWLPARLRPRRISVGHARTIYGGRRRSPRAGMGPEIQAMVPVHQV